MARRVSRGCISLGRPVLGETPRALLRAQDTLYIGGQDTRMQAFKIPFLEGAAAAPAQRTALPSHNGRLPPTDRLPLIASKAGHGHGARSSIWAIN